MPNKSSDNARKFEPVRNRFLFNLFVHESGRRYIKGLNGCVQRFLSVRGTSDSQGKWLVDQSLTNDGLVDVIKC